MLRIIKLFFSLNNKDKNIANIHIDMYQYVQSTIVKWVCDQYFNHHYAEFYINHDDLEKCRWYLYCADKGFHHHVLNPIADVALEIFRYIKDLFGVSGKEFQDIKSAIAGLQKGELIIKDNTLAELGLGSKSYKKIKVTHLI